MSTRYKPKRAKGCRFKNYDADHESHGVSVSILCGGRIMIGGLIRGLFRLTFGGRSMFDFSGMLVPVLLILVASALLKSCSGTDSSFSARAQRSNFQNCDIPVQTPPPFGQPRYLTNGERSSRLRITTSAGLNYFVTLTDSSSHAKCLEVFLQGGQDCEIAVPLGNYEIAYAAGTTWYGPIHLFGPETQMARVNATASFKRGTVRTLEISRR